MLHDEFLDAVGIAYDEGKTASVSGKTAMDNPYARYCGEYKGILSDLEAECNTAWHCGFMNKQLQLT